MTTEYANGELLVESGRVSFITINRPEKRNALSTLMMRELTALLYRLDEDPSISVIVIKGAGRGFSSGADLGIMGGRDSILACRDSKQQIGKLMIACREIRPIIISSVHGFALAGGFGLATVADITIVTDDCMLGMPEIKVGLGPMNIMNHLSRLMPRKYLLEFMLTGENIKPSLALQWGIVSHVVPACALEETTAALAKKLASYSASTLSLIKQAFYSIQDMDFMSSYQYLSDILLVNTLTEDAAEGTVSFLEKRSPVWRDC